MTEIVFINLTELELVGLIDSAVTKALSKFQPGSPPTTEEPIDQKELMKRLRITRPTVTRWQKKGVIPFMRIGRAIRYDYQAVLKALEKKK